MRSTARLFAVILVALSTPVSAEDAVPPEGRDAIPALENRGLTASSSDPALPFASTPALRAETVARQIRTLRAADPVAADKVAGELARHDYDTIFRGLLDGTGLRADDAGDVLAGFLALQWMIANDSRADPSPAAFKALRRQVVNGMASKPPFSEGATRAAVSEEIKLRAVLQHSGWQGARRLGNARRYADTLSNGFIPSATLRTLSLTDQGFVPKRRPDAVANADPAINPPPPRSEAPAGGPQSALVAEAGPPRHAANWSNVEGVYFRSATSFGVGGLMVITFEPLILFNDGTTYEIEEAALEDVDLAARRIEKPRRFGRWTRSGTGYELSGTSGKPTAYKLQDGSFFKAFPAAAGETLPRGYSRISGGGNTAFGGDVMIAVSSSYDFRPDGTYGRNGSTGAMNSGASAGGGGVTVSSRRRPEGGRYALDRFTLTLTGSDGLSRRRFFAFGSQKDPPKPDRDMIFIGDDVFTVVR